MKTRGLFSKVWSCVGEAMMNENGENEHDCCGDYGHI
jgi:hypothetical protein